jgi:hypothetical protein
MVDFGTPGSSVTHFAGDGSSPNVILEIEPMPPRIPIRLLLTSRPEGEILGKLRAAGGPSREGLEFYMQAEFLYDWHGEMIRRRFLVPLEWNPQSRRHTSGEVEEGSGSRPLIWTRFM